MKANENHINDELLVKYLLGEASLDERSAVDHWVNASTANARYFDHFRLIWDNSKKLVIPSSINADAAWKRFQQRTEDASKKQALVKQMNASRNWVRAAAVAILITGAAVLSYFFADQSSTEPIKVASTSVPVHDTLPDGSVVTLNKNSSISYPKTFKGAKRKIELQGEGFFTVRPDPRKPFVVSVNDITVTVVGTSFNIKSINGTTQVVVETGIVRVTRNNKTIELRPNEKLVTDQTESALRKERITDRLHEYYRSKEFVCDNTPLWKLVEVLNEAYNSQIVIERKELRNLPLTTTFYNESLEKILSVIAETFELSVERRGDQILLK